jgi:peptidoglycan/LPS O-acetylase OafA/YrhL
VGLFRLALSVIVVMFHFGGFPPLAGRVSVFSFFCISGYLMALVIDRAYGYRPSGALRFYLNRALRIVPLFALYAALTMVLLAGRLDSPFFVDPTEPLWAGTARHGWLDLGVNLAFRWEGSWPLLGGSVSIVPQAWSLLIEGFFYLCAPLLALAWSRARPLFVVLAVGSIAINVDVLARGLSFDSFIYQNYFATLWVFQLGMTLYYFRDRLVPRLPAKRLLAAVLFVVYVQLVVRSPAIDLNVGFYVSLAVSAALVLILGSLRDWPTWFKRIDKYAGDIAYGVFVNHFFAAMVLLELNELIFARRGSFDFFGRINQPLFGHWTVVLSVALSALTFLLLERPLQHSRDRVRGVMISPAPELPLVEPAPDAARPVATA